MYCEYLKGERVAYSTRISLQRIRCGFYRRTNQGGLQYCCDEPPLEDVASTIQMIRTGYRPSLHVYDNPQQSDEKRFVSPDDVASLLAYQSLGVRKAPVIVLSALEKPPEESALGMRVFNVAGEYAPAHVVSTHSGCTGKVPALVGHQPAENTVANLQVLRRRIASTQRKLKRFHAGGEHKLHYHHTLYSTQTRLDDSLRAVVLLLRKNLWHEAVPLLRTLYEVSLNFYIDWLAPQDMHAFFAIAAVLDTPRLRAFVKSVSTFKLSNGTQVSDPEVHAAVTRTFDLIRTVRNKAEISPLGLRFYKNMYSFMSAVSHQDFEVVANFAHTLERAERPQFSRRTMESLLMSADVIVAQVVLRIEDDLGDAL